jgi:hypothetical protein
MEILDKECLSMMLLINPAAKYYCFLFFLKDVPAFVISNLK